MAFWYQRTEPVDFNDFDPDRRDYTQTELDAYAEALLKEDIKENGNVRHILFKEHLAARDRREIKVGDGIADETLTNLLSKNKDRPVSAAGDGQMMYNRTHPRGRKVNSKEQRSRNGASYYR